MRSAHRLGPDHELVGLEHSADGPSGDVTQFRPDGPDPDDPEARRARLIDRLLDHSARDNRALRLAIRLIEAEMHVEEALAPQPSTPAHPNPEATHQHRGRDHNPDGR